MAKRKHLNNHKPGKSKSRAQHQRNPLLNVRLPRALYTQLQEAAKADSRTLANWLRLNLPSLLTAVTTTLSSATTDASK